MADQREQHIKEIFISATALHGDERNAYLESACRDNPALRSEVESLLRLHDASPSDPVQPHRSGETFASTEATPLTEKPGMRIGPYKLLQKIGEGGFGVVFMADQERPVRRRVALKIIKLGMDTRRVVARFEAERQALAMMEHPNIARVLDAGASESGRPYFVMELVKGDPITSYCDRNNLTVAERLELFAQVCNAVQHAHTKSVIHRDIKPSNVLATTQDGRPHAKVIDFGIAKATDQRLTDKTLFTEHNALIGTPAYMSPEQAEGSLDIDTRTDIYALGVLLYELLTGSTPFDNNQLREAAFGEIHRIIREVEPIKPSTRISQSTDDLETLAARRRTEPNKLGILVRGELDWIVMKALEKDRARRYETASSLADDLHRHLTGEPVIAAPPSAAYRFRKFAKRNKGPVMAASIVLGTVLVSAVLMTVLFFREQKAVVREQVAKEELQGLVNHASDGFDKIVAALDDSDSRIAGRHQGESGAATDETPHTIRTGDGGASERQLLDDIIGSSLDGIRQNKRLQVDLKEKSVQAERARKDAESEAYVASIMAADTSFSWDEPGQLLDRIKAAPAGRRGWEWSFLRSRSDASLLTFPPRRSGVPVSAIAVSADGSRVVAANADYSATVFDAESGVRIFSFDRHEAAVKDVSISSDGLRVVTTSANEARVWELLSGDEVHVIRPAANVFVRAARFSGDCSLIAIATSDGVVHLWDARKFTEQSTFTAHRADITALDASEDGRYLVTASIDGTCRVWTLPDAGHVATFTGHNSVVRHVCVSPDGSKVVSTADNSRARVWDIRTGEELISFDDQTYWITNACFSRNGRQVAATAGTRMLIIDVDDGGTHQSWLRGHRGRTTTCAFSHDGRRVYSGADDGKILAWDSSDSSVGWGINSAHFVDCSAMWNLDGSRIVVCPRNHAAEVWDLESGQRLMVCGSSSDAAEAAHFTPSGARIVTKTADGGGAVWDAETGAQLSSLVAPGKMKGLFAASVVHAPIHFSPEGTRLIAPGEENVAELWDRVTGRLIESLEGHSANVTFATFSPDGTIVVTTSSDKTARLWSTSTRELRQVLSGHTESVTHATFSPDGARVATFGQDRRVCVWRVSDGTQLDTLELPVSIEPVRTVDPDRTVQNEFTEAVFSPDGTRLLVPLADGAWVVRDVDRGRDVCMIHPPYGRLSGPAFDPDSRRIVAGSGDGLALVFDAESGRQLLSLRGNRAQVGSCAFSPDGSRVLTYRSSGELSVYDSVPQRTRYEQRRRFRIAKRQMQGRVDQLMRDESVAQARGAIAGDRNLSREQRWAAHALITLQALQPEEEAAFLRATLSIGSDDIAAPDDVEAERVVAKVRALAELSPDDPQLQATLGIALYHVADFQGAITACHRSEELAEAADGGGGNVRTPRIPRNWMCIAMAQARLGRKSDAKASLRALRELVGKPPHTGHPKCQRILRKTERMVLQALPRDVAVPSPAHVEVPE